MKSQALAACDGCSGLTALMRAALSQHLKIIHFLLEMGANPDATSYRGEKAYDFADDDGKAIIDAHRQCQLEERAAPQSSDVAYASVFCKPTEEEDRPGEDAQPEPVEKQKISPRSP